jgi:hypothetical protein
MLSTTVRRQAEFICSRIAKGQEVQLADMQWIQKWAKSNHSVESMLRRARRAAVHGDEPMQGLDAFMQAMDLGDPDPTNHLSGAQNPVSLAEWFSEERKWFQGND